MPTSAEDPEGAKRQRERLNASDPLLQQETHWMWLYLGGPVLAVAFVVGSIVIIRAFLELMIVIARFAGR